MYSLFDWNAIGTYLSPVITGALGWLFGRKKTRNDFLSELQSSIDMLSAKNSELIKEVVGLREENAQLLSNQVKLQLRIEVLTEQNIELRKEVEALNEKLAGVKTITRRVAE